MQIWARSGNCNLLCCTIKVQLNFLLHLLSSSYIRTLRLSFIPNVISLLNNTYDDNVKSEAVTMISSLTFIVCLIKIGNALRTDRCGNRLNRRCWPLGSNFLRPKKRIILLSKRPHEKLLKDDSAFGTVVGNHTD